MLGSDLISLWGDAYGHIHQEVVNDNHAPDNSGVVLYADLLFPLVALALCAARERLGSGQRAIEAQVGERPTTAASRSRG